MLDFLLTHIRVPLFAAAMDDPGWRTWPFGFGGGVDGFWPNVAKAAYVLIIFGLILLVLRKLFGPGGPLRPEGFDTMEEAEKKRLDARKTDSGREETPSADSRRNRES